MAGIGIRFLSGDLTRWLRRAGNRCRDMTPAFREMGRVALRSARENFARGGRPRWKRRKKRQPWRLMHKTKALRDSLKVELLRTGIAVGSDLHYASYHQFGTRRMPARPFVVNHDEDLKAYARIVERYIVGGL